MSMKPPKLVVLVGPTSSGKTALAVKLARKFQGEIVSADSRQVYRGMDLGTGKDLAGFAVKPAMPHHLIDVVSPRTTFTLARYQKLAYLAITDILQRGKLPILVGGTGLYVQAVVDGYVLPKAPPDPFLRKKLAAQTLRSLRVQLQKLDPKTYRTIDKNNRRRMERAIEICLTTGRPLSQQRLKNSPPYQVLMLGLNVPQPQLHARIEKRLQQRLQQGLAQEVRRLHQQGVSWKRLESFGLEYRFVSQFLRGQNTLAVMKDELLRAIKNFARRQNTWFKRDPRILWICKPKQAEQLVQAFLSAR